MNKNNITTIIIIFIIILLFLIYIYLYNNYNSTYNSNNNSTYNSNFNNNDINDNLFTQPHYIKENIENDLLLNVQGYKNELMYSHDNIKCGSYVNQYKEINFNNIPINDNQIGFNPNPKCSSKELPFANINVNYLLNKN